MHRETRLEERKNGIVIPKPTNKPGHTPKLELPPELFSNKEIAQALEAPEFPTVTTTENSIIINNPIAGIEEYVRRYFSCPEPKKVLWRELISTPFGAHEVKIVFETHPDQFQVVFVIAKATQNSSISYTTEDPLLPANPVHGLICYSFANKIKALADKIEAKFC